MDYTQKIFFIIMERKGACLNDLMEITKYKRITILRALSKLLVLRKIKSLNYMGTKFFIIIPKNL
jgi:hypothetical protein